MPTGPVQAQAWQLQVGRVPLCLLDTNLPENRPEDRAITNRLYGGDSAHRLRQEIILGLGGYQLLTTEQVFRDYQFSRDHEIAVPAGLTIDPAPGVAPRN